MRHLQAAIDSKNGAIAKSIKAKQPPTADKATQQKIILENEIEALKLELLQYKTSMRLVGTLLRLQVALRCDLHDWY